MSIIPQISLLVCRPIYSLEFYFIRHKRSTFEQPVFDSLAYSTFVQNKEANSRFNRDRRKIQTDKGKMGVKHQRTMTGYKNSLIFSQKEREVRPAALRERNFKYGQNNWINWINNWINSVNEIGIRVHSGKQAFRKHNFHKLVRFQNVNMVDNVAGENDYQSNYVKFGFRLENAKNIRSQKSMFLRKLAILTRKLNEFSLNRTALSNLTERAHYPKYNSITRELNKTFAVTKSMQYPTHRPGKVTEIKGHLSGTIITIINEINRILTRKLYELCTGKRAKKGSFTQFKSNKTTHTSSDALESVAGFMFAEGLVLRRIARSVPRRSIDQTDLLNSQSLLFSKVDENKISNLRHKAQVLPKIYQRVSMEIIEGRIKSLSCRTLKQLLAHIKSLHTSADDIVLGRSQDNQSIPQDLQESLALLRLLRNTSKQQSEQETSKTGVVNNIFRRLRSADPTNRRPRPATLTNRVSESAINSLVIKTINRLIAHLYELRRTVATLFPEIAIEQNQTNLFLDSVLGSRSKEIVDKEVGKKLHNETKKLKLLCLYLCKMPIERVQELISPQSQTFTVLNNQQSFQNLPEEKITRKPANCGHIVSGILRNIIRKKRHAPLKEEKVPSYTAVSEIALKTLADLIAKVFRLYSAISAYLPKLSGHVEVNVTNVLSEVTEFKVSPGNVFARKALKAIRVTAAEIYEIMEILVLASRPKKSQDVTKLIDEHTILAALLGALGHVLQWALNLTDIMLDDLTRNETYSFGSGVQVTVGKTEDANDVNNVTAEIFLKLTPKLSNAFETILKNILHKDVHVNKTNVTSVTQTTSRRSTWKKKRKYDDIYETRRLVSPHHFKNNFYKKSFYRQFRKGTKTSY